MINKNDNPVEWALLIYELDEAREYIEEQLHQMKNDDFCDIEFAILLGHVQAHLNRAWHVLNLKCLMSQEEFEIFNQYPTDLVSKETEPNI